jgi:hypothetical protein
VLKVGDCGFPRRSPLRRSLLRVTLYHCPLGDQTLGRFYPPRTCAAWDHLEPRMMAEAGGWDMCSDLPTFR